MGNSSSSSSSGKSSGKAKFGNAWTSTVYFDPEADKDKGPSYNITDDELIEKLSNLVDVDEQITQAIVYKLPLSEWQITDLIFYHNFVLFETNGWWWTIEKNSEGITIQRSRYLEAVKDRYRQNARDCRITIVVADSGRKSVGELIRWLYKENELNKKYNYLASNCKGFAKAVFNFVAQSKTYPSWF